MLLFVVDLVGVVPLLLLRLVVFLLAAHAATAVYDADCSQAAASDDEVQVVVLDVES